MQELVPGIFRIESVLGPRPFSQWVLRDERALLVDSGMAYTPADVILPALGDVRLDWLLISHADVDHHGGNAALKDAFPGLEILAGAADIPFVESAETILRDRYGWYDEYGIGYPDDVKQWLRDGLGPDTPVDVGLAGDEELRLGPRLRVRVLHLPGHTAGHLGLWHEESRTAIVQDAVMASGLLDTEGTVVHPPPVPHVEAYERSVRALQELRPERLLTAHYHPIEGAGVGRFLDESLEFVERAREVVAENGDLPLAELLALADERLGPFTSMPNELATTLRALGKETAWSSA